MEKKRERTHTQRTDLTASSNTSALDLSDYWHTSLPPHLLQIDHKENTTRTQWCQKKKTFKWRSLHECERLSFISGGARGLCDWGLKPCCCPLLKTSIYSPLRSTASIHFLEKTFPRPCLAPQPHRQYWLKGLACFTLHLNPHLRQPFRYPRCFWVALISTKEGL